MEQFAARSLRKTRLFLETGRFDTNSSCEIAQKFRSLKREKEEHFWWNSLFFKPNAMTWNYFHLDWINLFQNDR